MEDGSSASPARDPSETEIVGGESEDRGTSRIAKSKAKSKAKPKATPVVPVVVPRRYYSVTSTPGLSPQGRGPGVYYGQHPGVWLAILDAGHTPTSALLAGSGIRVSRFESLEGASDHFWNTCQFAPLLYRI
jgi:hypothetical protein